MKRSCLGKIFIPFVFSLLALGVYAVASPAADCGCDFTLKPKNGETELYVNGATLGVKPGNKVCIPGGTYDHIYLYNFIGTPEQPITVTNCTGKVKMSGNGSYGFILNGSSNVHVTGTGDPAFTYGFLIDGTVITQSVGFAMGEHSTGIELDHIEVYKTGAGFIYAPTPNCDQATWGSSFTINNLSFHHNYVHDTGGEAFYIGNTSNTYTLTCNGITRSVTPQVIHGLKIYNNLIERSGWDGIQVASAPVGVEIYNNVIRQHGMENRDSQQAGIILGGASNGKVYNNLVLGGTGNSFQCFGVGTVQVYNNVFANGGYDGTAIGQHGVIIASRPTPAGYPKLTMQFMNNTIISPKCNAVVMYNEHDGVAGGNIFGNNIIVNPGSLSSATTRAYFDVGVSAADVVFQNNITKPTVAEMKFADPSNNDFNVQQASIAVDAGMNAGSYGVTKDFNYNSRPAGAAFDVGAYEYVGAGSANQAPAAGTLKYRYYTFSGTWYHMPNLHILTPASTGTADNITLANKTQNDNFAYLWDGYINIPVTGTYTFRTTSDDGSQFWIGDLPSPLINNDGLHATQDKEGTITLNAGVYPIAVLYYEQDGGETMNVSWKTPQTGGTFAAIPNSAFVTEPSTKTVTNGPLKFRYYTFTGTWYNMPNLHGLTPVATGTVANVTLANKTQNDRFAFLWEGFINIPVSGSYTFRTTSDDGSQFWIGSLPAPLIVNDGLHGPQDRDGTITLTAGAYPIAFLYFEQEGGETMNIFWKTPETGNSFAAIPNSAFVTPAVPATSYENPAIPAYNMARSQTALNDDRSDLATGKIVMEETNQHALAVFPNPAIEKINLRLTGAEKGIVQVKIINALGIAVKSYQYRKEDTNWQEQLNISGLAAGYYFIEVKGKTLDYKQSFIKK